MVVAGIALLLCLAAASHRDATLRAQGSYAEADITGTWHIRVPLGDGTLIGFYTYGQSGTLTGAVNNMFGGLPYPAGFPVLGSPDHGVWRHVPGRRFEFIVYRMILNPVTSDIFAIGRIRAEFGFEGDRDHLVGTYRVAQWFCPTPTTCPDPTSDPPDVPEFSPPVNTFTQSRVTVP